MIEVVPASPAHIGPIAHHMREADRVECEAFGRSPKSALRIGLRASSWALTAKLDGVSVAMFGVTPVSLVESRGVPWFLGTEAVYRHGRALLRDGPRYLSRMSAAYRHLENHVWAGNVRAIRMLRAWGFTIDEDAVEIGGLPFLRFWRVT